jgi:hypothetical protein
VPYTVIPPTENVTASSTHEAGADDPVTDGDFAVGVCEEHPATPIPATISAALVSLGTNLVGIVGTRQPCIGDDGKPTDYGPASSATGFCRAKALARDFPASIVAQFVTV